MTLEQIEELRAKFCSKCDDRNWCHEQGCGLPIFMLKLQQEWQLQTLRDLGGTTNYYDVKR